MWPSNKDIPLFVGVPVIMTHRVWQSLAPFTEQIQQMHSKSGSAASDST